MRWFLTLLLVTPVLTHARTIIQMKDFLCGCDHCETVPSGEPLNISRHLIMCHSWRESTMKTFRLMEQMKLQDSQGVPVEDTLPTFEIPDRSTQPEQPVEVDTLDTHADYQWRVDPDHGWTYSTTDQTTTTDDGWLYREDLKWVWTFGPDKKFLYSMDHGWFYNFRYQDQRLLYWYDRRYWLLASDFWWKK